MLRIALLVAAVSPLKIRCALRKTGCATRFSRQELHSARIADRISQRAQLGLLLCNKEYMPPACVNI